MKTLAAVALIGLAYGSEDNELFRTPNWVHQQKKITHKKEEQKNVNIPGPMTHLPIQHGSRRKNITENQPNYQVPTQYVPKKKTDSPKRPDFGHIPHGPKNNTRVLTAHRPINRNHTRIQHQRVYHPLHPEFKRSNPQPYHPIHKNATRRPVAADEDDELFLWNRKITNPIFADEDDEFFYKKHSPAKSSAKSPAKNRETPKITTDTEIPKERTRADSPQRTSRPVLPIAHGSRNRTKPILSIEDEELFVEDNELMIMVGGRRIPIKFEDEEFFNLEKLLADASKTVGDVKQKEKNYGALLNDAINIVKDIKQKDDFADNSLFDLEKLLADASKTVGDVKKNPKNYGALLNDAIDIVKDIKRKDDFEDHFLRVMPRPHNGPM